MINHTVPHTAKTTPCESVKSHQEELLACAVRYVEAGFSLIPVTSTDKSPRLDLVPRWTKYQTKRATIQQVTKWIESGAELALVCGNVSCPQEGYGLEVIDFDAPVEGDPYRFFEAFEALVRKAGAGDISEKYPIVKTGGNGFQLFYYRPQPRGAQNLAYAPCSIKIDPSGREIAIETRANRNYVVIPPSLHKSGEQYKMLSGALTDIPTNSEEEAEQLLDIARSLCEAPKTLKQIEIKARAAKVKSRPAGNGSSVIDAYNNAYDIRDILEEVGCKIVGNRAIRPEGESESIVILEDRTFHHNSNDILNDGYAHKPFDLFCAYKHSGNVAEAVKNRSGALE